VAALVRAYHPALTVAQVTKRLQVTADYPGTAVPDKEVGFGVVNPLAAVSSVISGEGVGAAQPTAHRIPLPVPPPGGTPAVARPRWASPVSASASPCWLPCSR